MDKGMTASLQNFLEKWHIYLYNATYKYDNSRWSYVFYYEESKSQLPMSLDMCTFIVQGNTDAEIVEDMIDVLDDMHADIEVDMQLDKYLSCVEQYNSGNLTEDDVLYSDAKHLATAMSRGRVVIQIVNEIQKAVAYLKNDVYTALKTYQKEV